MIQIKKILVPTDNSDASLKALRYAIELSKLNNATIHLLSVVDERYVSYMSLTEDERSDAPSLEDKLLSHMTKEMDEICKRDELQPVKTEKKILIGHPSEEILGYSDEIDADLIIMGTHGHTGLSRVLIGSVAERVVRRASRPVLVVRPDEHEFVK